MGPLFIQQTELRLWPLIAPVLPFQTLDKKSWSFVCSMIIDSHWVRQQKKKRKRRAK